MTHAPAVARSKSDQPISTAELELLNVNICLWREVTDEAFERHYRQRYFGNEWISRQQAIERLAALRANCLQQDPADDAPLANGTDGPAAMPANAHVDLADIQILVLPSRPLPWRSVLLSILAHGLILLLFLSIKLPRSKRLIDFDTVTITYYNMSDSFPNVAPKQRNELSQSRLESKPSGLSSEQTRKSESGRWRRSRPEL